MPMSGGGGDSFTSAEARQAGFDPDDPELSCGTLTAEWLDDQTGITWPKGTRYFTTLTMPGWRFALEKVYDRVARAKVQP
jgi:hypothetical protein